MYTLTQIHKHTLIHIDTQKHIHIRAKMVYIYGQKIFEADAIKLINIQAKTVIHTHAYIQGYRNVRILIS